MIDGLQAAREFANRLRFSGDTLRPQTDGSRDQTQAVKSHLYRNALQSSPQVTPDLSDRLISVYKNLKVPVESVAAFVHASPEIQAECYSATDTECVLRFSSALIDLLNEREFAFVAGHEIGHFLLEHGLTRKDAHQESIEFMIEQRSQEISVDRIGLLACGSLDVAIQALMKTVSGLSAPTLALRREHIRVSATEIDQTDVKRRSRRNTPFHNHSMPCAPLVLSE